MLYSALNHFKTVSILILVSVMFTACGGGSGSGMPAMVQNVAESSESSSATIKANPRNNLSSQTQLSSLTQDAELPSAQSSSFTSSSPVRHNTSSSSKSQINVSTNPADIIDSPSNNQNQNANSGSNPDNGGNSNNGTNSTNNEVSSNVSSASQNASSSNNTRNSSIASSHDNSIGNQASSIETSSSESSRTQRSLASSSNSVSSIANSEIWLFRGTPNNWGTNIAMVKVGNLFTTCQNFTSGDTGGGPRFKISNGTKLTPTTWVEAYPASDYPVSINTSVDITFDSSTHEIIVTKRTSACTVSTSSSKASSSSSKSSSSMSKASSSSSKLAASSKATSSAAAAAGALGATIQWSHPTARENGTYLNLDEIGGYQIRYKSPATPNYAYIKIPGNSTTTYKFTQSVIGLQFEIAIYDNQGLYSNFVPIAAN